MPEIKPRNEMPRQDPLLRSRNFDEVALGYNEEQARSEADRCLQCKKPLCVGGCPVCIDIPAFIKLIAEGRPVEASLKIKEANNLPMVCGRVCPQESQCEERCVLTRKFEPVAIGRLERHAGDRELEAGIETPTVPSPRPGRVAVVGSGPAGLTCAADLARLGYRVTIFEALHKPGGVLQYGIPPFRLPRRILNAEIDYIRKLGVEIICNVVIGKSITVDELLEQEGFDAVFLGTGAGAPTFMNIPGENLNGVYSANEFLTRVNLMSAYRYPTYATPVRVGRRVAVVGAGNVAMDSARCSLRLGADEVLLVYRRSRAEMPARHEEIENAEEEGIKLMLLTNPVRILDDGKGSVKGMEVIKMELGEPDDSGRRRPIPLAGSEHLLDVDMVIMALGTRPNPLVPTTTPGLETSRHGTINVDPATLRTSRPGVYAGGDIVTGAATVIEAMGAGKTAARSIHELIQSRKGVVLS